MLPVRRQGCLRGPAGELPPHGTGGRKETGRVTGRWGGRVLRGRTAAPSGSLCPGVAAHRGPGPVQASGPSRHAGTFPPPPPQGGPAELGNRRRFWLPRPQITGSPGRASAAAALSPASPSEGPHQGQPTPPPPPPPGSGPGERAPGPARPAPPAAAAAAGAHGRRARGPLTRAHARTPPSSQAPPPSPAFPRRPIGSPPPGAGQWGRRAGLGGGEGGRAPSCLRVRRGSLAPPRQGLSGGGSAGRPSRGRARPVCWARRPRSCRPRALRAAPVLGEGERAGCGCPLRAGCGCPVGAGRGAKERLRCRKKST